MILLIDNYDSFSYNLFQLFGEFNTDIKVVRNDEMTAEEILEMKPEHVILSPGPGYPKDAGVCEELLRKYKGEFPILGVCLGHQAICEVAGASICHAKQLMHGKMSRVKVETSAPIFSGLPDTIEVARYHSLVAKKDTIPETLNILSVSADGEVMAVRHKKYPMFGLQFHPESILTPDGKTMIQNFLNIH